MPEEKIPRVVEGAEARTHDIDAKAGFVHSCIDGILNIDDIADVTALSHEEVLRTVERLVELQLVEWVEPTETNAPPTTELEPDIDLNKELQTTILETFHEVGKLNHYERLGVERDATRSEIRKAYFALSKTFHPDAYYGKSLGSFQSKMEVVFRELTDSYEALGRPNKREAYDRYLDQQLAVNAAERQIDRVERRAEAMARALAKAPVAERYTSSGPPPGDHPSSQIPDAIPLRETGPPVAPGSAEHLRMERKRQLLERKLGRRTRPSSKAPGRAVPTPTARVGKKTALRDLTRSLKRTARVTGGVDRAQHHIEAARAAEAKGDLAAAATSLRMALTLDPARKDVREQYKRVNSSLRIQLVDIHREQARYEEENGLWAAASISWAKVTEAAPEDADPPRRAARAIVAAGGDLRKARDFALHSLELKPDSLDTRLLLARIYIDAGMARSAATELDEAAKLDPEHEMVKNLRKQLGG